jgi:hypothetical protein
MGVGHHGGDEMIGSTFTRRALLKLSAAGALAASPLGGLSSAAAAGASTLVYDDFSGGPDAYNTRWFPYTAGPMGDPVGIAVQPSTIAFIDGRVRIAADPFTMTYDNVDDHIKYLAISTAEFAIPDVGCIAVAADIAARTRGATPGRYQPSTGHYLFEGQQATVTLHLFDFATGAIFDWLVSETRAIALYERLFITIGLDKGYTQILGLPNFTGKGTVAPALPGTSSRDFAITPGMHNYAMRYTRNRAGTGADLLEWLIDGVGVARVARTGIPLDTQFAAYRSRTAPIRYPAAGPGEDLKPLLNTFRIGHGLFSLLDEFPFNQPLPGATAVPIPPEERIFGQGASGTWGNVTVTTVQAR